MLEPAHESSYRRCPRTRWCASSILDLVGDTPIVDIQRLGVETPRASCFAKSELVNPGGSVKDRICLGIVEAAERAAG